MVKNVKVELEADVAKVINLADNEIIDNDEAKKLLSQFEKDDLIDELLLPDEDDEDDEDEDEDETEDEDEGEGAPEVEVVDAEVQEKQESTENKTEDPDAPITSEDDDFEDLLT